MAHHLTPRSGRGGFTVDANSGRELVFVEEGRRACTKVVVAGSRDAALGREDWPDLPINSNAGGGKFRRRHDPAACVGTDGRQAILLSQAGQDQRGEVKEELKDQEEEVLGVFPLPSEVAADDSVLADIKSRSAAEAAQKRARADRERNQLQKAMEQSHDEAQKQKEREEEGEKEEEEELVRALRLSREESTKLDILEEEGSASTGTISTGISIDEMDDEEFDRLLEASRREEEEEERRRETQEREELERALQLSQQQQQAEVERNNVDNDDEDDEELLKVLALSERESRRQSLADNENNIEEEEADLRRAMEESLAMASEDGVVGLDGIAGTGHLTDDEEAMIRQVLELSQL